MKIVSWNVNGLRSVMDKGFLDWLRTEDPDIICLQEIKIGETLIPQEFKEIDGYYAYFNSAVKPGYSGVAVYSKIKPNTVETKLGIQRFDDEGRCLKLTFDDFVLFNFYIPNGWSSSDYFAYKLSAYDQLINYLEQYVSNRVIMAGDFNVAHTDNDVGFFAGGNGCQTPPERERIDRLLSSGWIDAYRSLHPTDCQYTWFQPGIPREKNMGWRLDYFFVTPAIEAIITNMYAQSEVLGSDHCPLVMETSQTISYDYVPVYEKQEPQPSLF